MTPRRYRLGRSRPARRFMVNMLREVVAEKTGYPVEMLELDMRLDADLGIDSIKRVEILSAVQDRLPAIRTIGPEHTAVAPDTPARSPSSSSAPIGAAATPSPARTWRVPGNGQNGKLVHASGHTTSVEPSRNGHGHPDRSSVVLRRLEARLVPMSTPTVGRPCGFRPGERSGSPMMALP